MESFLQVTRNYQHYSNIHNNRSQNCVLSLVRIYENIDSALVIVKKDGRRKLKVKTDEISQVAEEAVSRF
jgi:hypothetical protein